jgi:hypothetical protein
MMTMKYPDRQRMASPRAGGRRSLDKPVVFSSNGATRFGMTFALSSVKGGRHAQ